MDRNAKKKMPVKDEDVFAWVDNLNEFEKNRQKATGREPNDVLPTGREYPFPLFRNKALLSLYGCLTNP